ncbi:MAG: DUF5320 domain-containing protein [Candidatus Margulisbacteria bacterium]|nr:DUF5320 domain-containing protein [Candidatus Margulisiibacteriota bacterium]MBU1021215.1 DUF5320 domain-containing protein [Candidatus Margulisiibacteriota bacterium]MBU1729821.1 DUF5320 domain-containing protein [Candidatus Margulisiibacteriota bacterium]MBU1955322.1 DUF5320 domain-containing protein [Candidatus Margulisiibacteriota bacterium]
MPSGDGTGPWGRGPGTGWGCGPCGGGRRFRRGQRSGWGGGSAQTITPGEELAELKQEKKDLDTYIADIESKLKKK